MSGIGAGGKIINDAVEGKFDVKNFAIQAGLETVNFGIKKFTGNNTLNSIMLQNGASEIGKGIEELNKKQKK